MLKRLAVLIAMIACALALGVTAQGICNEEEVYTFPTDLGDGKQHTYLISHADDGSVIIKDETAEEPEGIPYLVFDYVENGRILGISEDGRYEVAPIDETQDIQVHYKVVYRKD